MLALRAASTELLASWQGVYAIFSAIQKLLHIKRNANCSPATWFGPHFAQGALNATVAFEGSVPEEIIEFIREESAGSIVRSRPEMHRAGAEEMARRIETTKTQITDLYKSVNRYNPHFWRLMLDDPYSAAASRPISYSPKSEEEACLVTFYSLASWIETYRSFDIMRDIIEKT